MTKVQTYIWATIRYLLVALVAAVCLYPLLFLVCTSFFSEQDVLTHYRGAVSFRLIPDMASLSQYYTALLRNTDFLRAYANSFLIAGAITVGQTAVAFCTAFAMEMYPFRGRNVLFAVYLVLTLIPYQVMQVPNAIVVDQLRLDGTYAAVILPQIFSAFGVCLLRMFLRYMPKDSLEAARLDGCGEAGVMLRVALPQAFPTALAVAFLIFLDAWNMVEAPLIFLKDTAMQPLSVQMSALSGETASFCYSLLYLLPAFAFFIKSCDHLRNMVATAMPKS